MVSIIICSRYPAALKIVSQNVALTIGVPYEIIAINNSQGQYGICQAYNIGAAKSQYELLCFMHEDIEFRTNDWGKVIQHILFDNSIGVVGITGGKWLADSPGTWWSCGNRYLSSNLIDHSPTGEYSRNTYSNPESKTLVDVAAVDGLWMCMRKKVWERHPFDEKTFPGFHFYDVDFCANILHEYRVCVTLDISIAHFSLGSYNDAWYLAADVFYCKHTHRLPLGISQLSTRDERRHEYNWFKYFIHAIINRRLPVSIGYRYLAQCIRRAPFSKDTLWLAQHFAKYAWQNRGSKLPLAK